MTRSVPEWIGKTSDSRIPPKVRLRVFAAQDGKCSECGKKMGVAGEPHDIDHIQALVLGGENREGNLRAVCKPCHKDKTRRDVRQKATEARKRSKHLGIERPKANPMPGSKASKWKRKMDGTVVLRD